MPSAVLAVGKWRTAIISADATASGHGEHTNFQQPADVVRFFPASSGLPIQRAEQTFPFCSCYSTDFWYLPLLYGKTVVGNGIVASGYPIVIPSWLQAGSSHAVTQEDLEMINVVPNPYLAQSWFQTPQNPYNRLRFIHLPQQCRITIFTITGERVATLDHNNEYDSNEWWDLKNGSVWDIARWLYIYTVEAGE